MSYNLEEYYRKRAPVYEELYYKCDLIKRNGNQFTADLMTDFLKNRIVLEIACGTGYWTRILSTTAKKIIATDLVVETIDLAKKKDYMCLIDFKLADAYDLPTFDTQFNGGLAAFWFSHIPLNRIDDFLIGFHQKLEPESNVFICDNNPRVKPEGKLITKPNDKNTYRHRLLPDGSEYNVLKNYFSVDDLIGIFSKYCNDFDESNIFLDENFWRVQYTLDI